MVQKIVIVGPESTGKSELSQQLARELNTEWVPEYARFYLDRLDRDYEERDLAEIARGQLAWEDDKMTYADKYLICDTNLMVIKVWSDHKYGYTEEWIEEALKSRKYDFYLLSNIDLPWRNDPQREHPNLRKHFLNIYRDLLEDYDFPYRLVSGIEEDRLASAMSGLREMGASI